MPAGATIPVDLPRAPYPKETMASPSSAALSFPAIAAWVRRVLGHPQPARQHPFDLRYGVDTEGLLYAADLSTGHSSDRFNEGYYATAPSLFEGAIACWRQTLSGCSIEDYAFIDLGCGMGRVLLLASRLPFRCVRGIELHPRLARLARRNARKWLKKKWFRAIPQRRITVETGDVLAVDWQRELAAGPLILFLFNSFGAEVLTALLCRLADAAGAVSGSFDLIYLHPDHDALVAGTPGMERLALVEVPLDEEDAAADAFGVASDAVAIYRFQAVR